MDSGSSFRCPYCPCSFVSQHGLDLHLKAFSDSEHYRLWKAYHILLEENLEVDGHGDWRVRKRDSVHWKKVRVCQKLVSDFESERAERLSETAF